MSPPELTLVVSSDEHGQRLDQFLAEPVGSRAQAAKLIAAGAVTVDGRVLPKRHVVSAGETVTVAAPVAAPPVPVEEAPAAYDVVWEDEHLLVVDKPAGVVVHPARGHRQGTLAQALAGRAAGGDDPTRPGIVHRLDRDTSGLLVVAKREDVHRALKAALAARKIHREYVALVDGIPSARTGTIDAPIGRDRRDRTINSVDTDVPREARTHFTLLRAQGGESLLRVVLDTGRTHQIRVHLAAIGHPVVGDRAYRGPVRHGLERQFLHAGRLSLEHPVTGEPLDVRAPLAPDLRDALERAGWDPDELRTLGIDSEPDPAR